MMPPIAQQYDPAKPPGSLRLLGRVVTRLDFLYEPDPKAALLPEDQDILDRRAAGHGGMNTNDKLTSYCIRIVLDADELMENQLDAADIQEEIQATFPRQYEVLRSVPSLDKRSLRLRLRRVVNSPLSPAKPNHLSSTAAFLPQLKLACSRIYEQVPPQNRIEDIQDPTRVEHDIDQSLRATYDAFFTFVGQYDWRTRHNVPKVLISTDENVNLRFSRLVYNPTTKYLDEGEKCTGCSVYRLQHEISDHDDVSKGYCQDCIKHNFFPCVQCSSTLPLKQAVIAPCNCKYCGPCLGAHFAAQVKPETFPPRCCGHELDIVKYHEYIPEASLKAYAQIIDHFNDKVQLHCAKESCEAYIKPSLIRDEWGLCEKCFFLTCQRCRLLKQSHSGVREDGERACPEMSTTVPEALVATDSISMSSEQTWPHVRSRADVSLSSTTPPQTSTAPPPPEKLPQVSSPPSSGTSSHTAQTSTVAPSPVTSSPTVIPGRAAKLSDKPSCSTHNWTKVPYGDMWCEACWKNKVSHMCKNCHTWRCWTCRLLRRAR